MCFKYTNYYSNLRRWHDVEEALNSLTEYLFLFHQNDVTKSIVDISLVTNYNHPAGTTDPKVLYKLS